MELKLGNSAILAYRRLSYRPWYAIAEFVDNSTDAYFRKDNRTLLDQSLQARGEVLTVEVTYDKATRVLRVMDNSMGMSYDDLDSAMIIGEPPVDSAGRSEFGMGMKTAAIWFANKIQIRSKKLGESEEVRVDIDIQEFVRGNQDLKVHRTPKPAEQHYTIIELQDLQRRLGTSALGKARQFLGSIYREDLRSGVLELIVNGDAVALPPSRDDDVFLKRSNGTPFVVSIDGIDVHGKTVKGWMGVLGPDHGGRNRGGFALIRHGRAVNGWLDSWRPDTIFGDASNSLINQRITGELIMDGFSASHTKDAIDWESDDEEVLGKELKRLAEEYGLLKEARRTFKDRRNQDANTIEAAEALAVMSAQLDAPKVIDEISLLDVPKPELAKLTTEVLIDAAAQDSPVFSFEIGQGRKAHVFEIEISPNDPYFEYEVLENADLRVVINRSHPAMASLRTAEAILAHYHHVVLDAVAEWKCAQQHEPLNPSSIRLMKDRLFRVINEVEIDG